LIKQAYNVEANCQIVSHWCWEDEERTQWILEILIDLICKAHWNACDHLFKTFESVLELHDSIEEWRVELAFNLEDNGVIDVINYYKDRYPKFTQTCIKFTLQAVHQYPTVAGFLYASRKDWWSWLEPWLKSRLVLVPSTDELVEITKELTDLTEGRLQIKNGIDYTPLWKHPLQHDPTKHYKLFLQKF